MKKIIRVIAFALAIVLSVSGSAFVFAQTQSGVLTECGGSCDTCPSIVIPGVFQCESFLYNENGEKAVNSDGEIYSAPFFLDSTLDIVTLALKKAVFPLLMLVLTQRDIGGLCAKNLSEVLAEVLAGKVSSDATGKLTHDVRATKYNGSFATLSEYDQNYILKTIPLQSYVDNQSPDHLYFFSYFSFGNIIDLANELYEMILRVREETGHNKVNLVPISQGGSLCTALLELHPDVYTEGYLNRIVYVVPAIDGANTLGDIYAYGLLDDDEALYSYMFPILLGEDEVVGYLVNLLIRILPKDDLNNILDTAVDTLIEDYLEYTTCMWALVPSGEYPIAAQKYLSDPEDAEIKRQTDIYYQAQLNSKANIRAAIDAGVKVFDVVDYNDYLYPICDSWNTVNSDGIIQVDSTSIGATTLGTNITLPDDYTPVDPVCTNPDHNHIDPYRILDASTGLLPETTFYFYNQNHERTANNDVIMKLVVELITDEGFTDIYSYPDRFPQFNVCRNSKGFIRDVDGMRSYNTDSLSAEDKAELAAAIAQADAVIANTVVDVGTYEAACYRFYKIRDKILYGEKQDSIKDITSNYASALFYLVTKFISETVYKLFGARGL